MINDRIIYELIGKKISHFRIKENFTQEKLAQAVSLDRSSISNIEQGRQKILLHTVYDFARALKVEVTDLLPLKSELAKAFGKADMEIPQSLETEEEVQWFRSVIEKSRKDQKNED